MFIAEVSSLFVGLLRFLFARHSPGAIQLRLGWERLNGEFLFDLQHELFPRPCGLATVAFGFSVVVVAEPHRSGELGDRTDKPQVPCTL